MKTPEQTLSDLLALGEKAVQFTDDRCIELGLATKNALPAVREYMKMVEGLRTGLNDAAETLEYLDEQMHDGPRPYTKDGPYAKEAAKLRALSQGGK